jgi:uncharacterized protein YlzI (FlbEa/FlbD family)
MIPVDLASERRLLVNVHLIEAVEAMPNGSVIVTGTRRIAVVNSAAYLLEAIEAVQQEVRSVALERLTRPHAELQLVRSVEPD